VARVLSGPQRARWLEAVAVARELAASGGYDALTMQEVADRVGVARATIYRYFLSKDHLLAELSALWIQELSAQIAADPPPGRTAAARVRAVLDRVVDAAEAQPLLTEAVVRAALSPEARQWHNALLGTLTDGYFDGILGGVGDLAVPSEDIGDVLGNVLFSGLIGFALHGRSAAELRTLLHTTVGAVLR
jgi:TetR/AcrR family transcriptional regulator, cholesterol catabolism regulator